MHEVSRAEAKAQGLRFYFTGKPCKRGHYAQRDVASSTCLDCAQISRDKKKEANRQRAQKWREKNRAKHRAYQKRYYAENKEYYAGYNRAYYEANSEAIRAANVQWHRDHADRKRFTDTRWKQENKGRVNASVRKRQLQKLMAMPAWADEDAIRFFYECRPAGCHVDHIVPLQGENVCGLHVETNLQWLTVEDNLAKGNSFEG